MSKGEREAERDFVRAAAADDVPEGTGRAIALGETEIALFRLDDEFFAIENTCPHRGASLGDGEVQGDRVICPLHHWQFNIRTGALPMGGGVATYPTEVRNGEVFVDVKNPSIEKPSANA